MPRIGQERSGLRQRIGQADASASRRARGRADGQQRDVGNRRSRRMPVERRAEKENRIRARALVLRMKTSV